MRAIVIPAPGGPETLTLRESPDPQPGPHQVRIRVAYASINYIDIMGRQRGYHISQFPYVPGLEVSGHIHALGKQVTGLSIGQPVAAILNGGGYAEFALAEANLIIPLESGQSQLDLATAAAFPIVATTAYDLLVSVSHLQRGETVLIHAAAGGVGSLAGQLARILGAERVWGTVGNTRKIAAAQSAGFDRVFLRDEFIIPIRELTAGQGVDVILDASGEPTRSQSLDLLAPFGRLAMYGNASANADLPIAPSALLSGNKGVLGYSFTNLMQTHPQHLMATAHQVLDHLVAGRLHVAITEIMPFEQAARAHALMESNTTTGKLLLQMRPI